MKSLSIRAGGAAILFAVGLSAAAADEPGPGGTKVPRPVTGEQVYRAVCQACHMADARGGVGAAKIPALAGNPAVASSDYVLTMIANGRGAMPSLTDVLDPVQMAAVTQYVRTHFGNREVEPVTAAQAKAIVDANR